MIFIILNLKGHLIQARFVCPSTIEAKCLLLQVFGIDDALPSRVSVENLLLLPQDKSFSLQSVPPQVCMLCASVPIPEHA